MSTTGSSHRDPHPAQRSSPRRPAKATSATASAAAPASSGSGGGAYVSTATFRNSSTPVNEETPVLTIPTAVATAPPHGTSTRWGDIMYPSTTRGQRDCPPGTTDNSAATNSRPSSTTPPPQTTGLRGTPHTMASVPLHVTVGEDSELQELASAARQRVHPTHPRPTSRTVPILGRPDAEAAGRGSAGGGLPMTNSPSGASSGTPLGVRPGSGTRHQHNPYDSVSPIKVLTPVSPPQAMAVPGAGQDLRGGERHGSAPVARGAGTGTGTGAGLFGERLWPSSGGGGGGAADLAHPAQTDATASRATAPAPPGQQSLSGLVLLPTFQPPPPFFPGQGVQSDRTVLYEMRRDGHAGPQGPQGQTGQTGAYVTVVGVGGWGAPAGPGSVGGVYHPTQLYARGGSAGPQRYVGPAYASVPGPLNPSGATYGASPQASMPSTRRGTNPNNSHNKANASTSPRDTSAGTSPPPGTSNSADESGADGRGLTVLYPPLSPAAALQARQYVEAEEPHLNYPLVMLPDEHINKGDTEEKQRRIEQRRKQIQYGRETSGYLHYCAAIPEVGLREFHNANHPVTPRPEYDCSKRTFDKFLNEWRRRLHHWDECDPNNLQPSFWPLGAVTLADLGLAPGPSHASPRARGPQSGPAVTVSAASDLGNGGGGGGGGGMLSIATHATAAMSVTTNSPIRTFSRDGAGTGMGSTGSFRNNPYCASARSGISASPIARGAGGSPGSALFTHTNSSFVLTSSANGRTSTCTPSQGPKVDANFFSPASSSSRAGSPAATGNLGSQPGGATLSGSEIFQIAASSSGHNNLVSVPSGHDGGASSDGGGTTGLRGPPAPRGSGRGFQRSNSAHHTHASAWAGGQAPPQSQSQQQQQQGSAAGSTEVSHHATPFHHDRALWAGGAPHTPHHNHVLNGPRLFDFDTLNSPVVAGSAFTPQQSTYRTQYASQAQQQQHQHTGMPSVPPVPSFSTPTSSPHGHHN